METTSIGVIRLHISVNVTTSENKIETLSNICKKPFQRKSYYVASMNKLENIWTCMYSLKHQKEKKKVEITSQVSIGFSPVRKRSATCFGII